MNADVTKDLLERIADISQMYERFGATCVFEGQPMMHLSHLEEISELALRAEAALSAPQPDAGLIGVQWWLAELDQYGNPALVDGAHSGRSGADQALYLLKALHLDAGRRFAVARVELSEPKPSGEGVNHEAIKTLNDARREAQP